MASYEDLIIFFSIIVISFLIWKRLNGLGNSERLRYPPSLPSLPLVGSLPFLRNFNNIPVFFMEKSKQLGPIFSFRVGNKLILTLNTKEAIEDAYMKNSRHFSTRQQIYQDGVVNPNSKGISFVGTTEEWKKRHRIVLSIMKELGFGAKNIMEERTLREFDAMTEFIKSKGGRSLVPKELFVMTTSNIISNIMIGRRREFELGISPLTHEFENFAGLLDMVFDVAPITRYLPPFRSKISAIKNCMKKILQILEEEVTESLQDKKNDCFVRRYVEMEGPNYDREQLNFILRDIISGGIETTAITLQWFLVVVVNRPELQKKLQKEIDSVILENRLPTLQDQSSLPFVEATILELFRWRTLVPLGLARMTSSDCILNNYYIPGGTWVLPNMFAVHSDPDVWENPDEFRPERFLDKDNQVIGRDRLITFSLGKRSCLGEILARAELFLIIASLVKRFTVQLPEGQDKLDERAKEPVSLVSYPLAYSIRLIERQ